MYVRRPSTRYDAPPPIGPSTESRDEASPTAPATRCRSREPSRVAISIAPESEPMCCAPAPELGSRVAWSTASALTADMKPPRWNGLNRRTPSSSRGVPSLVPPRTNGTDTKSDGAEADGDIAIARRTSVSTIAGSARICAGSTTKASRATDIGSPLRPPASTANESSTIGAGPSRIVTGASGSSS